MAKKEISCTDLIWIFNEELKAFDDFPKKGISIAIVPMPPAGWTALTMSHIRIRQPHWVGRIQAIEKRLRKLYILAPS